jgi:hypothetical protein
VYLFDFGDDWTHLCTVGAGRIDPLDELGILPDGPLSYWGWGDIPDQYGRRWDGEDGESPPPADPRLADLPPLLPWWGPQEFREGSRERRPAVTVCARHGDEREADSPPGAAKPVVIRIDEAHPPLPRAARGGPPADQRGDGLGEPLGRHPPPPARPAPPRPPRLVRCPRAAARPPLRARRHGPREQRVLLRHHLKLTAETPASSPNTPSDSISKPRHPARPQQPCHTGARRRLRRAERDRRRVLGPPCQSFSECRAIERVRRHFGLGAQRRHANSSRLAPLPGPRGHAQRPPSRRGGMADRARRPALSSVARCRPARSRATGMRSPVVRQ